MALVSYEIKNKKYITKCPYKSSMIVGSHECLDCKYCKGVSQIDLDNYISCLYAEDVASRNKKPKKQKSDKVINPVKFKCICGHNQYFSYESEEVNPRIRTETVLCKRCKITYKLEFTLTNQIVPYKKRRK